MRLKVSVVNTRPSSIETFAAAILTSIWAMRCLRNIATVVAYSGTSRWLSVVLGFADHEPALPYGRIPATRH
jgi:hypothetical protein